MLIDIDTPQAPERWRLKTCDRWCYFGGSSKQDTHQVSSNTVNPMQMQQYQQNYADAQQRVGGLTPYTGPITAGFNPNQTQAQGILSGVATDPRYQQINSGLISSLDDTQLAGKDLSPYYNPFQKDVIDASIAQNQFARDQQGVADNASATAAHAFGGTRQAVQRALTTEGYDRNNQQNIAGLNTANFQQAQQAAQQDIANKFNRAGAVSSLNNNGLQLAAQQGGILSAVGDAQQQQSQRELSDAYNAYLQGQQLTITQQQLLNQALGIIPLEQTNTTDGTTTTKSNPGIGGILGGVASLGLAAATGGSSLGLTAGLGGLGSLFGAAKQTPAFMTNGQAYY